MDRGLRGLWGFGCTLPGRRHTCESPKQQRCAQDHNVTLRSHCHLSRVFCHTEVEVAGARASLPERENIDTPSAGICKPWPGTTAAPCDRAKVSSRPKGAGCVVASPPCACGGWQGSRPAGSEVGRGGQRALCARDRVGPGLCQEPHASARPTGRAWLHAPRLTSRGRGTCPRSPREEATASGSDPGRPQFGSIWESGGVCVTTASPCWLVLGTGGFCGGAPRALTLPRCCHRRIDHPGG